MALMQVKAVPGDNEGDLVISFTFPKEASNSDYITLCKCEMDQSDYLTYSYITMGNNTVRINCNGYETEGQLEARYISATGEVIAKSAPFAWSMLPSNQFVSAEVSPKMESKKLVKLKTTQKVDFIEVEGDVADRKEGNLQIRYHYSSASSDDFVAICQENDSEGSYMTYSYVDLNTPGSIAIDCSGYMDYLIGSHSQCEIRYYNANSECLMKTPPFYYFDPPKAKIKSRIKSPKVTAPPKQLAPFISSHPSVPSSAISSPPSIPQRPISPVVASPPTHSSLQSPPPNSSSSADVENNNTNASNSQSQKKKKGLLGKIGKMAKSDTSKSLVEFGLQQFVGQNLAASLVGKSPSEPQPEPAPIPIPSPSSPVISPPCSGPKLDFKWDLKVDREEYPEYYIISATTTKPHSDYNHEYEKSRIEKWNSEGEPNTPAQQKHWISQCYWNHRWRWHPNATGYSFTFEELQEHRNKGYMELTDGGKWHFDNLETMKLESGGCGSKHFPNTQYFSPSLPVMQFYGKWLKEGGDSKAMWVVREPMRDGSISYYTLTTAEFKKRLPNYHPVDVWAGDVYYTFGYGGTWKPAYCWQLAFQSFYNSQFEDEGNNIPPSIPSMETPFEIWDSTIQSSWDSNYVAHYYKVFTRVGVLTLSQLKEYVLPRMTFFTSDITKHPDVAYPISWRTILYPAPGAYPDCSFPSFIDWRRTMPDPVKDCDSGRDFCVAPLLEYCFGHVYWNFTAYRGSFYDTRKIYENAEQEHAGDDDYDYTPSKTYSSSSSSSSSSGSSKSSSSTASKPAEKKEEPQKNWYWAKVCNDCSKKCACCGKDLRGVEGKAKLCWQECGFGLKKDNCVLCGKSFARNQGKLGSCCKSKKAQTCCQCNLNCRDR